VEGDSLELLIDLFCWRSSPENSLDFDKKDIAMALFYPNRPSTEEEVDDVWNRHARDFIEHFVDDL
jgi:hypothetical protein